MSCSYATSQVVAPNAHLHRMRRSLLTMMCAAAETCCSCTNCSCWSSCMQLFILFLHSSRCLVLPCCITCMHCCALQGQVLTGGCSAETMRTALLMIHHSSRCTAYLSCCVIEHFFWRKSLIRAVRFLPASRKYACTSSGGWVLAHLRCRTSAGCCTTTDSVNSLPV
jgi:hypothetical protein